MPRIYVGGYVYNEQQRRTDIKDHQKTVIRVCSGSIDQIEIQYQGALSITPVCIRVAEMS
jgi:hypothetical protein